jgi:hypothetical protein
MKFGMNVMPLKAASTFMFDSSQKDKNASDISTAVQCP